MRRRVLYVAGLIGVIILAVFANGPRVEINTAIHPVELPSDLDSYLAGEESVYANLVPGTEKKIVWAGTPGEQTNFSIVYIHGFSASRQEIAPLPAIIAEKLHANLFSTRLSGHGRGGTAMLEGSVNAWLNDLSEAMEIGRRLGRRVVLVGTSTGATLAAVQAHIDPRDLAGLVLLSPNFGPVDRRTVILTWPWGAQLAELLVGKTRTWQPENEAHGRYWTHSYPVRALVPMMGVVQLARSLDWSTIQMPVLVVCSPTDGTVDSAKTAKVFRSMGSTAKKFVWFDQSRESSHHVLAGDILSSESTGALAKIIIDTLAEWSVSGKAD